MNTADNSAFAGIYDGAKELFQLGEYDRALEMIPPCAASNTATTLILSFPWALEL